jgi:transposase-like protein
VRDKPVKKIMRFVVWMCKRFERDEILEIVDELLKILNNENPDIKFKDDFKKEHPNYRDFSTDPLAPLDAATIVKPVPQLDYKSILVEHEQKHGKPLKPVNVRDDKNRVPCQTVCPNCSAPHEYIYYNDGKKRTQLKCKVCSHTFQLNKKYTSKTKFFCPYCFKALFKWKQRDDVTIYKCGNDNCPHRLTKLNKLNKNEKEVRTQKSSQFKINYQYRDYHYEIAELNIEGPQKPKVSLDRIHNDRSVFALILTLHISYAITARKTAHMLKNIWGIAVSHQTVLNYTQTAAYYCHKFNQKHKGNIDDINAGDETYIKVKGVWHYVWMFICSKSKKICAYHLSDNRGAKPAITTMLDAVSTAKPDQDITLVADGNPSYQAGLHFINSKQDKLKIKLKKVIGLQNMDEESEEFRPYKQMIERLNRTYKYHIQAQNGFATMNGAISKLVLFVTYYNFLRPHKTLGYKTPIQLPELTFIDTIQGKWSKIISLAA